CPNRRPAYIGRFAAPFSVGLTLPSSIRPDGTPSDGLRCQRRRKVRADSGINANGVHRRAPRSAALRLLKKKRLSNAGREVFGLKRVMAQVPVLSTRTPGAAKAPGQR